MGKTSTQPGGSGWAPPPSSPFGQGGQQHQQDMSNPNPAPAGPPLSNPNMLQPHGLYSPTPQPQNIGWVQNGSQATIPQNLMVSGMGQFMPPPPRQPLPTSDQPSMPYGRNGWSNGFGQY